MHVPLRQRDLHAVIVGEEWVGDGIDVREIWEAAGVGTRGLDRRCSTDARAAVRSQGFLGAVERPETTAELAAASHAGRGPGCSGPPRTDWRGIGVFHTQEFIGAIPNVVQ